MRSVTISSVAVAAAFIATTAVAGQRGHTVTPQVHATTPHTATTTTHGRGATHATAPTSHGTTHTARTSTTTATASSPIATKIESHPQLASRLTAMLPKNMTLQQAAAGFRNQGQFIAALHVSHNLGIPFADLKKEMVTNHNSLGQSIQKLRPGVKAETEAEHAEIEADHDLGTTTATAPTTTKHGKKNR